MLIILEIILTITAWRKGYKAWALLPMGLAILIAFMIGASDPTLTEADLYSLVWLDILAIVALGVMIAAAKKPVEVSDQLDSEETEEYVIDNAESQELTNRQFEPTSSLS